MGGLGVEQNLYFEVHLGAWSCMRNMLWQSTACSNVQDSLKLAGLPVLGNSCGQHSVSCSFPESLLFWLNPLCLFVELGSFLHSQGVKESVKNRVFSGHGFTPELFILRHCPAEDQVEDLSEILVTQPCFQKASTAFTLFGTSTSTIA